ncbi:MAG: MFS transporter [Proteobacteria bacterium]|nr:MFS transporter [Pseudomonadota bacterium]
MTMNISRFTPYYLSLFYFLFFAWMGIQIPYFNLYLYHIGMTPFEIGIISASIPLVRIFSPALWGYVADRFDQKGMTGKGLWILSTLSFSLLFFANSFASILIIMIIFTFFWAPTLPITEASTMMTASKTGIDYGRMRVGGTFGFILLSWIMGRLLDNLQITLVLWGMMGLLLISTVISFRIPMKKGEGARISLKSVSSEMRRKPVYRFLIVAMLMIFSHSTYYGFLSIYLESMGYTKTSIGLLWALGPVGEVAVMLLSKQILGRFGTLPVLKFSLFMAVIRWGIFAATNNIVYLIFAQLLHAFTFGTFHIASVRHVEELFPDNMKNTAQALYSSSAYGIGLVVGTLVSGFFYDIIGASLLFLMSAIIALIAIVMLFKEKELT